MNLSKELIRQFARFLVVGVLSNAVNFSVFFVLFTFSARPFLSSLLGFAVGTVVSYVFARTWVFNSEKETTVATSLMLFLTLYTLSGLSLSSIVWLLVTILGFEPEISWVLGAIVAVVINFLGGKLIFR